MATLKINTVPTAPLPAPQMPSASLQVLPTAPVQFWMSVESAAEEMKCWCPGRVSWPLRESKKRSATSRQYANVGVHDEMNGMYGTMLGTTGGFGPAEPSTRTMKSVYKLSQAVGF